MSNTEPRFQLHLSTCLVFLLVLGTLGTLNSIENFGSPPPWLPPMGSPGPGESQRNFGFPYSFSMVRRGDRIDPRCLIFVEAAMIDFAVAAGALWVVYELCERRHRAD